KRLGLRRFVFYDGREKTPDPRDQRATDEILRRLQARLMDDARQSDDILGRLRSLLRSFSAIEDNRSWYAKNLFPVHEEFLLWEALRKGSTLRRYVSDVSGRPPSEMDRGIEFFARNFFARGGELYYLLISAGTEGDLERRRRIAAGLRILLTERNQVLGEFARLINGAWDELAAEDGDTAITGTVGWIPDPHCHLYRLFAEDLDMFLDNSLDSLECLELLAHLISFHIVCYIYHRAHPASDAEGHASGSCLDACRPHMLVDLLGDEDGGMIREKSAGLLRKHDAWQKERAREYVLEQARRWAAGQPDDTQLIDTLASEAEQYFGRARTRARDVYGQRVRELRTRYGSQAVPREALIQGISEAMFTSLSTDFHTNFLAVHGRLGRAIGLIAPRKGPRQRFVLGDTLLKTLVLANVRAGETLAFGALLERFYQRYGIVVGPGEARDAGLTERLRIDEEHFTRNREALLSRMKR
ncbi:MAG TPA: hypothetical protein VFT99_25420, partial [Roseiflexaceae bacterium]|nr:hypothetical protein [Roseiflexaceae bacterium]